MLIIVEGKYKRKIVRFNNSNLDFFTTTVTPIPLIKDVYEVQYTTLTHITFN